MNKWTDRQTDNANSIVAFATETNIKFWCNTGHWKLLLLSRSTREIHPYLHIEKFPQRHRAHTAVGQGPVRRPVYPGPANRQSVCRGSILQGEDFGSARGSASRNSSNSPPTNCQGEAWQLQRLCRLGKTNLARSVPQSNSSTASQFPQRSGIVKKIKYF